MPTQVFTSGSSFTVPDGYILSRVDLAGGGGGGGAGLDDKRDGGGGGGSGGLCQLYVSAPPGTVISYSIGAAGAGGTAGGAGTNGGTSTCTTYSLTANGGTAGAGGSAGTGGSGGTASGGTVNTTGNAGTEAGKDEGGYGGQLPVYGFGNGQGGYGGEPNPASDGSPGGSGFIKFFYHSTGSFFPVM